VISVSASIHGAAKALLATSDAVVDGEPFDDLAEQPAVEGAVSVLGEDLGGIALGGIVE
jgi:hypothetical protein